MDLKTAAASIRVWSASAQGERQLKLLAIADQLETGDTEGVVPVLEAAATWGEQLDERFLELANVIESASTDKEEPVADEDAPFPDPGPKKKK